MQGLKVISNSQTIDADSILKLRLCSELRNLL